MALTSELDALGAEYVNLLSLREISQIVDTQATKIATHKEWLMGSKVFTKGEDTHSLRLESELSDFSRGM